MTDISEAAVEKLARCYGLRPQDKEGEITIRTVTADTLRAQATRIAELEAALATAREELVKVHADRPFVVGFNQGWDACELAKEPTP